MIVSYVDRDGVIITSAPETKYVNKPEDVVVIPQAIEGLRQLAEMGPVVVVSNQAGVGAGFLSYNDLMNITVEMLNQLPSNVVQRVYYCTHSKEDECDCRKPEVGMVEQARAELGLDSTEEEFFFGDFTSDMVCAKRAGCVAVGVQRPCGDTNPPPQSLTRDVQTLSDIYATDLMDAVNKVKGYMWG
jgi:histidinol-phosphate phosphatase family protein